MTARIAATPQHAIFGEGARLHLTSRLLARGLLAATRTRRGNQRRHWITLSVSLVADLVVWRLIRRERLPLLARAAIDGIDVATWASMPDGNLAAALAAQIAVELESGFAWGAAGVAVPVAAAAISTLARRVSGGKPEPLAHLSHLGAVVAGTSLRWVERRRLDRARDEHAAELSAKRARAFIAGQHAVAMGASSVVDQLTPIAMIVNIGASDTALARVRSGWKSDLAAQSQRHALYLDQAIRLWEQRHNDHPDLAEFVIAHVAEGDGTELVTGYQARALMELLDQHEFKGVVHIAVAEHRQSPDRRPGRRLALIVNEIALDVPPDPAVRIIEFDAGPPVMIFAAWASLMPIAKRDGAVPLAIVGLTAGAWLSGAFVSLRDPSFSRASRQMTLTAAIAALEGALYSSTARTTQRADGTQLFLGTYGIAPLLLLAVANAHRLAPSERWNTAAAAAGIAALAYRQARRPRSFADYVSSLAWPAAAAVGSTGIVAATQRQSARLAAALAADDESEERAAYDAGVFGVLVLMRDAIDEAEVAVRSANLTVDERASIEARLAGIRTIANAMVQPLDDPA